MFQTLPNKDCTCLEGYDKEYIEGAFEVLTLVFYRTQFLVRDGYDPRASPCPRLRQTRRNKNSGQINQFKPGYFENTLLTAA
jgi:hypothetical protein